MMVSPATLAATMACCVASGAVPSKAVTDETARVGLGMSHEGLAGGARTRLARDGAPMRSQDPMKSISSAYCYWPNGQSCAFPAEIRPHHPFA